MSAGLVLPVGPACGAASAPRHLRIDVHHHFIPDQVVGNRYIVPPLKNWSLEKSLEDMEQGGITTPMLSVTPQVLTALTPGGDATPAHYRHANEFAAKLVADHSGRSGLFAGIPITDPDAALKEIDHSFGCLKADGIGLFTATATAGSAIAISIRFSSSSIAARRWSTRTRRRRRSARSSFPRPMSPRSNTAPPPRARSPAWSSLAPRSVFRIYA